MPFIKDIFKKGKRLNQVILLIVFMLLPAQLWFFSSLYVDILMGAFFGFALIYYFTFRYEESAYGILMIASSVFLLTLAKHIGVLLALGVVGFIIVDSVFFRRTQIKKWLDAKSCKIRRLLSCVFMILPLLSVLFVRFTWTSLYDRGGFHTHWEIPTISDVISVLTLRVDGIQRDVVRNFVLEGMPTRYIFSLEFIGIGVGISFLTFCVIFGIVAFAVAWLHRKKLSFPRMITSAGVLLFGAFLYQFVLLLMYAFSSFSDFEALRLASYERYTFTYLMGMMLFIVAFYLLNQGEFSSVYSEFKEKVTSEKAVTHKDLALYSKTFAHALLVVILCYGLVNHSASEVRRITDEHIRYPIHLTRPTAVAAQQWQSYFENSNVYFLAQGDNGRLIWQMRFNVFPNTIGGAWSIGTEEYNIWTTVFTPEGWEEFVIYHGFDFVWVFISNEELQTSFGHFFPYGVQENMMYRVNVIEGSLALIPVS
jgi:hypothetical protein